MFWIEEDGIVVLDYKTDRVKTGKELADRYASQLKLYGEALERIYNHGSERTLPREGAASLLVPAGRSDTGVSVNGTRKRTIDFRDKNIRKGRK